MSCYFHSGAPRTSVGRTSVTKKSGGRGLESHRGQGFLLPPFPHEGNVQKEILIFARKLLKTGFLPALKITLQS